MWAVHDLINATTVGFNLGYHALVNSIHHF